MVALLMCGATILVVDSLWEKDTTLTKKKNGNSTMQIEEQEESSEEELNESGSDATKGAEEENNEELAKDASQNFDNEVEVPEEWGE